MREFHEREQRDSTICQPELIVLGDGQARTMETFEMDHDGPIEAPKMAFFM